jgi:hypothetical protein
MSEDGESEGAIQTFGGSLLIADGEDDLFQPRQTRRAAKSFTHQAAGDPVATVRLVDEDAPYARLVALLAARTA